MACIVNDTDAYQMNQRLIIDRIPVVIFLAFLFFIGTVGNAHVLAIFRKLPDKQSTYPLFIKVLAIVDLATCVLQIPMEIFDIVSPYSRAILKVCKVFRFKQTLLLSLSVLILVLIAYERFNRICRPLKDQMAISKAKCLIGAVVLVSVVQSIPAAFLYGNNTIKIEKNLTKTVCFIADEFMGSTFLLVTYGILCFEFVASACCIVLSYSFNKKTILAKRKNLLKRDLHVTDQTVLQISDEKNYIAGRKTIYPSQSYLSTMKTTKTLLLVSGLFVIVFMPFVVLTACIGSHPSFKDNMDADELTLYHIGIRLILINNVANPFIYGFTDNRFKRNLHACYRSCDWFLC